MEVIFLWLKIFQIHRPMSCLSSSKSMLCRPHFHQARCGPMDLLPLWKFLSFLPARVRRPLRWALCVSLYLEGCCFLYNFLKPSLCWAMDSIDSFLMGHILLFIWPHWLTLGILPFASLLGYEWQWCFQQIFLVSVSLRIFFLLFLCFDIYYHWSVLAFGIIPHICITLATSSSFSLTS